MFSCAPLLSPCAHATRTPLAGRDRVLRYLHVRHRTQIQRQRPVRPYLHAPTEGRGRVRGDGQLDAHSPGVALSAYVDLRPRRQSVVAADVAQQVLHDDFPVFVPVVL